MGILWDSVDSVPSRKLGPARTRLQVTVRHLGTSPTISSQPLTSLHGFVCVLQTDTSSSYLAVDSTHTAVGRFRSLVRRSGTRCLTNSEIRPVVLTVLSSFLRQSCLVSTNVTNALEGFLNDMRLRYIYRGVQKHPRRRKMRHRNPCGQK